MLVHLRPVRMDLALPAIQFGAVLLALRVGERPGTIAARTASTSWIAAGLWSRPQTLATLSKSRKVPP